MARYLQEPPGVAERIALSYKVPLQQNHTYDQQHFVDRPVERNHVQHGGNTGTSPTDDELMKELARLAKEGSTTRSPP